jgi:hypothetical protein
MTTLTNVVVQIDPNLEPNVTSREQDDAQSCDVSSAGFTTNSTRAKLRHETVTNAHILKENRALVALLDVKDSDDKSAKTTKSTANKLVELIAQLKMVEQEKQALLKADADKSITNDLQEQASAPEELTDTGADSVGINI